MRSVVFGVMMTMLLVGIAPGGAFAAVVDTFHFWGHSHPTETKTFTSDVSGAELTVEAFQVQKKKVWENNSGHWTYSFEKILDDAYVTQVGWGIGVADYDDWNPLIDAKGPVDYLVLNLPNASWKPVSIKFAHLNPFYEDYLIYGSNLLDTTSYATFVNSLTLLQDSSLLSPTEKNPLFFADDVGTFQHIIVAAMGMDYGTSSNCGHHHYKKHKCGHYHNYDDFLVKKFQGTVVPVPPALPLLATGLIALGLVRRRKAS